MSQILTFSTSSKFQILNVTANVENVIAKVSVDEGLCTIFVPHATAAIILNEDEPGLKDDIIMQVETFFSSESYKHNQVDNNAQAHLAATFLGQSIILPIINSHLMRGTWQEILFVELDGPRNSRKIVVSIA